MDHYLTLPVPLAPRKWRRSYHDEATACLEWAFKTGVLTVDEYNDLFDIAPGRMGVEVVSG